MASATSMRAAVLFGPGDIRVTTRPVPRPGPDEVLVRVAMCGTCGTDLKILDGHFPQTPPFGEFTPGHEWTGTVAATGETVDEFGPGDRVCIEAHSGCGRCDNCLTGRYTACLNYGRAAKGHRASGMTADGGFAEYAVHHVSALYKLPDQLSWEDGVLITTAGTGLYGLDVAGGFVAGQDVVVFGPGPVGLTTVQVLKALGAARVICAGTRPSRLELARRLGADHVIDVRSADVAASVLGLTGGEGADLTIDCSGSPAVPELFGQVTKRGGKVLVVAFYPSPVTLDLSAIVRKDITLCTSRGEGGNNVKRAVALAAAAKLRGADLVTHRFALDDIAEAFRVLRERDGDPVKVVVVP
ncbi:MAG: alcohol dehydrogenase catalytic domain-containing protein [Nocardiopsaceae bacterium]|nr:alcohol dehydrogenase catalytic domain-containing protein [Nocardiopsaceae bacterium]